MDRVCPLCNALDVVSSDCPRCGHRLEDGGGFAKLFGTV